MKIEQWDIVRFRINPADRDLHPGVVVSAAEWCADERKLRLNVLACSKRVPVEGARNHQVLLNGADGLEFPSVCGCEFFHVIARGSVHEIIGRVTPRAGARSAEKSTKCSASSSKARIGGASAIMS